ESMANYFRQSHIRAMPLAFTICNTHSKRTCRVAVEACWVSRDKRYRIATYCRAGLQPRTREHVVGCAARSKLCWPFPDPDPADPELTLGRGPGVAEYR